MGINVKVQNYPKPKDIITVEARLEKDIRDCMRCRFFHNSSQCVASRCVKEEMPRTEEKRGKEICQGCPYRQSAQYCFPCMKKILERTDIKEDEKSKEAERYGKTY